MSQFDPDPDMIAVFRLVLAERRARHRHEAQELDLWPSVPHMLVDLQGRRGGGRGFDGAHCTLNGGRPNLTNTEND